MQSQLPTLPLFSGGNWGTVFLVLWVTMSAAAQLPPSPQSCTVGPSQEARGEAQVKATIGHNELHLARLSDAEANCDSALKLDPANGTAKDCLNWVALMLIDQDLNNADIKLLSGDRPGAIGLASKWARTGSGTERRERAWAILKKARSAGLHDRYISIVPAWLRETLITVIVLTGSVLFLFATRKIWREWQRGKWYGDVGKTKWSLLPLKELPAAEVTTGIATQEVLDALSRLGHELTRELWEPKLLLLRPTPPENYEPALISDFLSSGRTGLVLVPAAEDLQLEWRLHEVQLDQAMQNIQFKLSSGVDIGSMARLLRSIVGWLNAGAPTISGIAQTGTDSSVSIHLAATGGRVQAVAVSASTSAAPGVDPTHLSAERAVLKFLFRMRYPCMTNDEIDGFSALRQGACQFSQFASTVRGTGEEAKTRKSILAKAALNFGVFRASIPSHTGPKAPTNQCTSLAITDAIRQSVLLAEGVAHALVGEDPDRILAIDCFRQVEDWPGSEETTALRQQAIYNEAVVWREKGSAGRCVLMLTELLGERAPDTVEEGTKESTSTQHQKSLLPESIRFPARLARLVALAMYSREEWRILPADRAKLVIDDAEKLVQELGSPCQRSPQDHRLVGYMHVEALRAIGHVELLCIITGPADSLYHENRPTGLKGATLNKESSEGLRRAIDWMLTCEQVAPSADLFCDLAEAYLLLREFTCAQGYASHATLTSSPFSERAYYIATESFFLQNTDTSKAFAKKYAEDFKGTVRLAEFKSVREDLGIRGPSTVKATHSPGNVHDGTSEVIPN